MELENADLLRLPVIAKLCTFQSVAYWGEKLPKVLFFKARGEEKESLICLAAVIVKDEALLWKSCQDMLHYAIRLAAQSMKGFFGYELLMVDLSAGLKYFNPVDFSRLLINHSRKLALGEARLIQYGSLWGFLSKRVKEEWGKCDLMTHVDIYSKTIAQLDLYLKKLLKNFLAAVAGEVTDRVVIINHLGKTPIYQPHNPEQSARIKVFFSANANPDKASAVSIYIFNQGHLELIAVDR